MYVVQSTCVTENGHGCATTVHKGEILNCLSEGDYVPVYPKHDSR